MYLLSFSKEARTFDSPSIEKIGDILCLLFYLQNILTCFYFSIQFSCFKSNPTFSNKGITINNWQRRACQQQN